MGTMVSVLKSVSDDDDERLVFAEVYAPNRPDSDGEFMDAEGIKEMAYKFMKGMALDSVDSRHSNVLVEGCCVVESFIARDDDSLYIPGSWVIGMYIGNDDMWAQIKSGKINGFSMESWVKTQPVKVEMEIPPVITGKTMGPEGDDVPAEDEHTHTIYVTYSEEGVFLGGRTDMVSGHFHLIKRGSVTEMTDGHTHKFSHLDDIQLQEVEE